MAGKSKSSKDKENKENEVDPSDEDLGDGSQFGDPESTDDEPVIIEADATEVTETSGEDTQTDETSGEANEPDSSESEASDVNAVPEVSNSPALTTESSPTGAGTPVIALVFGGLIAGAIGYFGSSLAPAPKFDTSALSEGIAANSASLESVREDLAGLVDAPAPELPDLEGLLSEVTGSIQALTGDLDSLRTEITSATAELKEQASDFDARLLAVETAVPGASELPMGEELSALRQRIAEMTSEAQAALNAAQAEAASIARAAEEARLAAEADADAVRAEAEAREAELAVLAARQEALIDLKAAVETGAPFADLLEQLGPVPAVLADSADAGVPTLQSLQQSFPNLARVALAQSETVPEDASAGERLSAFLKRRTNARSLTPQDGDSPDAILSRAEALLGTGDLGGALNELDSLPESGKSALADWLDQATTRTMATDAVAELSATN